MLNRPNKIGSRNSRQFSCGYYYFFFQNSFKSCKLCRSLELFPKRQILDSSKFKEFADDNFKFDDNEGKFSKLVENTAGKGEIARNEQFLLFPKRFQKTCTAFPNDIF